MFVCVDVPLCPRVFVQLCFPVLQTGKVLTVALLEEQHSPTRLAATSHSFHSKKAQKELELLD